MADQTTTLDRGDARIVAAACVDDDGRIYSLPPPARHHTIMQHFHIQFAPDQQGFLTDQGWFASRHAAFAIATRHGQIVNKPVMPHHGLFSEDVW